MIDYLHLLSLMYILIQILCKKKLWYFPLTLQKASTTKTATHSSPWSIYPWSHPSFALPRSVFSHRPSLLITNPSSHLYDGVAVKDLSAWNYGAIYLFPSLNLIPSDKSLWITLDIYFNRTHELYFESIRSDSKESFNLKSSHFEKSHR